MTEGPTIRKVINIAQRYVSPQTEAMIMPLWRQGYDSLTIAQTLSLPEHEIANRLWKLRQQGGG
jgi:hypothetical protein